MKSTTSPFKFLESYSLPDKPLFFGRDREIEELYQLVCKTDLAVVYGKSGVGKTSLVRCGLASKFQNSERLLVEVRRDGDINRSLKSMLVKVLQEKKQAVHSHVGSTLLERRMAAWLQKKAAVVAVGDGEHSESNIESAPPETPPEHLAETDLVREIYKVCHRQVFLIFDQFEELFIAAMNAEEEVLEAEEDNKKPKEDKSERGIFIKTLKQLMHHSVPCTCLLVFRSEYLDCLTHFENKIPGIFDFKLYLEPLYRGQAVKVVGQMFAKIKEDRHCAVLERTSGDPLFDYDVKAPKEVVQVVAPHEIQVHLPHLQILLEKLYREAETQSESVVYLSEKQIQDAAPMSNVLDRMMNEIIGALTLLLGEEKKVFDLLREFVTPDKTKLQVNRAYLEDFAEKLNISHTQLGGFFDLLTKLMLLRPLEDNKYELTHDVLATRIANYPPRERRSEPSFIGNPYRGLEAYHRRHNDIFFGRKKATADIVTLFQQQNLVVVTGMSGTGKSSLVRAGVFPQLPSLGFDYIEATKPGTQPLQNLEETLDIFRSYRNIPKKGCVVLIDQFEELLTQNDEDEVVEEYMNHLKDLLEKPKSHLTNLREDQVVKIIITIRSDLEPQFQHRSLKNWWNKGKYQILPLTLAELVEAIEMPAELAACYFQPEELVRKIANEVLERPTALPLLSFALSQMYDKSLDNHRIIDEKIYQEIGVTQSLQFRADLIYDHIEEFIPKSKKDIEGVFSRQAMQRTMRHILLRMVSQEGMEMAKRQVLLTELHYENEQENQRVEVLLTVLTKERLLTRGRNKYDEPFVEPAHDALLWNWPTLWEWKRDFGSFNISFREVLRAAVTQWKKGEPLNEKSLTNSQNEALTEEEIRIKNNLEQMRDGGWEKFGETLEFTKNRGKLLWADHPSMPYLEQILASDDNWLNEQETAFVKESVNQKKFNSHLLLVSVLVIALLLFSALGLAIFQSYYAYKDNNELKMLAETLSVKNRVLQLRQYDLLTVAALADSFALMTAVEDTLLRLSDNKDVQKFTYFREVRLDNDPSMLAAYQNQLAAVTGYRANWLPDKPLELGTIGKFYNGIFVAETSLEDEFKISTKSEKFLPPVALADFKSKGTTYFNRAISDTSLLRTVQFDTAHAFSFKLENDTIRKITNLANIAKQVLKLKNEGKWDKRWLIITEVVDADRAEIIIAGDGDSGKLEMELSCPGCREKFNTDEQILKLDTITSMDARFNLNTPKITLDNIGQKTLTRRKITPLFKVIGLRN